MQMKFPMFFFGSKNGPFEIAGLVNILIPYIFSSIDLVFQPLKIQEKNRTQSHLQRCRNQNRPGLYVFSNRNQPKLPK